MNHTDSTQRREQPSRRPTPGEAASSTTLLVGSDDGDVALLRTDTGVPIWRASTSRDVGTLAHGGAQCYVALGGPLRLIRSGLYRRESPAARERRLARLETEPARLEAHSAHSGRLLWSREDWELIGRLDVGAEVGGEVVVVGSTSIYGDHALYGLDARTGATRWSYATTSQARINGKRFVLRGGRVYCYGSGEAGGLLVLDADAGQPIWSRAGLVAPVISPRGRVVADPLAGQAEKPLVHTFDVATGAVRQERTVDGYVRAVTDAGVAYLSLKGYEHPGLAAARLDDGRELWRAYDILTYQLTTAGATVYCAHIVTPEGIGEVEALEASSGHRRWRWRTPGDLPALLRLWGARTPQIAVTLGAQVGKALAQALTQPSPREVGIDLWREYKWGQWRRPYALHSATNAMWLAADAEAAYLGTRLGVFALGADDGRLLWHALPTTDVSSVAPALPAV